MDLWSKVFKIDRSTAHNFTVNIYASGRSENPGVHKINNMKSQVNESNIDGPEFFS